MSASSSTLRILSRPRASTTKTLLPFLYQTATIQQWKPAAHPLARRNISYRPSGGHHVPFEGEAEGEGESEGGKGHSEVLPPTIDEAIAARKTTITGTERAAFEKLYKTFNAPGRVGKERDLEVEFERIADEYFEGGEEPSQSLDKIFGDVLQGSPQLLQGTRYKREGKRVGVSGKNRPLDLHSLAEDIMGVGQKKTVSRAKKEDPVKMRELRLSERMRVDSLLENAQTDRELWNVLEKEVFEQVRNLDLDGTEKPSVSKSTSSSSSDKTPPSALQLPKLKPANPTSANPRVVFANYPHHLITALTTLRTRFPSSPLPLTLVPAIKALGRSPYALGATTTLYKHLIRTAWLQHSSYAYMDALLTDMHNGAIEFDADILALLDSILNEYDVAKTGMLGREMQMVYGMDAFVEGVGKIKAWRQVVAARLGVGSEERRPRPRRVERADLTFGESGRTLVRRMDRTGFVSAREKTAGGGGFRSGDRGGDRGGFRDAARDEFRSEEQADSNPRIRQTREGESRGRGRGRATAEKNSYKPLVEGRNDDGRAISKTREPPIDDIDSLLAEAEEAIKEQGERRGE